MKTILKLYMVQNWLLTIAKRLRGILTTVMAHQISQTRQNEPVDDRLLEVIMTINRDKRILIFFSLAFFFLLLYG
ncbi:hypothetical protein VTN49DRAFT_74 [Thermomyces lanuginosus]|uniref:uncharacterized protein n=1 Tax=Thermomyces lanuginosus TaxID=5541 RepID=UPI00374361E9